MRIVSKYVNHHIHKINSDIIGKKFGNLLVLEQLDSYKHISKTGQNTTRSRFKCICDCGVERVVEGTKLRRGKAKYCMTCAYKKRPQSTERLTDEERMFSLFIVNRCKGTNIKVEINVEEYINIASKPCFYCNENPKERTFLNTAKCVKHNSLFLNGVDRINSSKNYSIDNCVSCCKNCNIAKASLTIDEFKNLIIKIYNNWIKQNDIIKAS